MPASRSREFIYIHIPKTAGTSVMQVLAATAPDLEYMQTGLWDLFLKHPDPAVLVERYRRVFRIGTLANAAAQHLPAAILRELVGADFWDRAFKFAFVRNPWDIVVSGYHYQQGSPPQDQRALNPDMYELLARCNDFSDAVRAYPIVRADMTSFLTDDRGELLVDFVGRYESLQRDFSEVCERIGISPSLPRENASEHAPYREYYTPETRAIVERHFARDIERFGYSF